MRLRLLTLAFALPVWCAPQATVLQKYSGVWKITRKSAATGKEELRNQCASAGVYFVCEQSNNGAVSSLIIFTPETQPNHFNTQNVLPDGRATGKGELTIDGKKWVFTSSWNGGGAVTRYRTTDMFTTPTQIEFTQEESSDGSHWQVKDSGEQARISR